MVLYRFNTVKKDRGYFRNAHSQKSILNSMKYHSGINERVVDSSDQFLQSIFLFPNMLIFYFILSKYCNL